MKVKLSTSAGDIVLELDAEHAPITTENFKRYVDEKFYDGTLFHRVIPGFMIQGGGFEPGMAEKKANERIDNEADNGLKNLAGTIAMARTNDPHSATAQFFINAKDNAFLDFTAPTRDGWGYCVFGKVVEGMDAVQSIEKVATTSRSGHGDVPETDVVIHSASALD